MRENKNRFFYLESLLEEYRRDILYGRRREGWILEKFINIIPKSDRNTISP